MLGSHSIEEESFGKAAIESPGTVTSLFQSEIKSTVRSNGPQLISGLNKVATLPESSLDTPTRSVIKFMDTLLTNSPEDKSPEVKTTNAEQSSIIADTNRIPCQSSVQESTTTANGEPRETIVESNDVKDEVTSSCPKETFDSDSDLDPRLKDSQETVESSDNTDTLKEENGLSWQESTEDETDLSQLTKDIVTDVIAMEKLAEQSAEQSTPLSSADMEQSELSEDSKDSSISEQRGDEASLEGGTMLHKNESNSSETKSNFPLTRNDNASGSCLSDLVPQSSTPHRQLYVPVVGVGETDSDSPTEGAICGSSEFKDDLTLEQSPGIALHEDKSQAQSPSEVSSNQTTEGVDMASHLEPMIPCGIDRADVNVLETSSDSASQVAAPNGEIEYSESGQVAVIETPVVSSLVNKVGEASDTDQSEHMDVDDDLQLSAQEENNSASKNTSLTPEVGVNVSFEEQVHSLEGHVPEEVELLLNLSSSTSEEVEADGLLGSAKGSLEEPIGVTSPSEESLEEDSAKEPVAYSHSSDEEVVEPAAKKIKLGDSPTMLTEKTQTQGSCCPENLRSASPPVSLERPDQKDVERKERSVQEELRDEVDVNVSENQFKVDNSSELVAVLSESIKKDREKSDPSHSPVVKVLPPGSSDEDIFLDESQLNSDGVNLSMDTEDIADNQSNQEQPVEAKKLNPRDTFVALRKAIVVLHDICAGQSKQAGSLSCSLPLTPSTELVNSLPSSPEHHQSFSDRSAPVQSDKSQSLPSTPCLERNITDLPHVLEDFKEDSNSESGVGVIGVESDKVFEKNSSEVCQEPFEKLQRDDTFEKSMHDETDSLITKEPKQLGDFVLDERTGVFVPGMSDSESKKDNQDDSTGDKMDIEDSPSSRKKYPMRATFSRLTRVVDTPKEKQSRQRRTSSVSITSSEETPSENPEKLLSKDVTSPEVEMRETFTEDMTTPEVKKGPGRPRKNKVGITPVSAVWKSESNKVGITPVSADGKSEFKPITPGLKRGPGRPRKVRRLLTSESGGPETDKSTPPPCQRILRKRTPQSQPQMKNVEKSRKRPLEEVDSANAVTSSKDVKVVQNKLQGEKDSQQHQESDKTSETQLKTTELETQSASADAIKPARRWPLKRVMGDFVSNKELLDLWTGLQPDMGPLKTIKTKPVVKKDDSTTGNSPKEVKLADSRINQVPVNVDASSQPSSSDALDSNVNSKDYLKVIFRSHSSSQRAKLSTNQSAPNHKGKAGDCVITSRKVISVTTEEFTRLKTEMQKYKKLDKQIAGIATEESLPPVLVKQLDEEMVVKSSGITLPPVLDSQPGEQISRKPSKETPSI
ncbi:dentin sialophosphoprotein-like [Asterias rubens]|uniref:dentin sialophosphoprotein-like n=1 Tax=Asterias rubens TaxID=7604 RepID=UPI0014559322|nr:dentin sialophosphoprotein-like [Asterias rubens]